MTTEEAIKILSVLASAYPGRFKATAAEATGTATMWAIQFATVPVDIVYLALQKAIAECTEHPPTPGKVKQKLRSLYWDAYSVLNDYGNKDLDEETKKQYPFDFVFRVTYALKENTLSVIYDVENPASAPLYFACGGHESYALDYDLDAYELVFEKEEKLVHCEHNDAGYLIGEYTDFGTHTVYPLPLERLTKSATVIFKNVLSRKVRLQEKNGKPLCELTFEGFENLLLWRAMRAKYICIEPWTNLPDIADKPDVEFSQKAGVIKVEPKDTKKLVRTITYL